MQRFKPKLLLLAAVLTAFSWQCRHNPHTVSLDGYRLEPGFRIETVAAEPLLDTPVAMCFDEYGRIWVAEMPGYMTDLDNSAENKPLGKIVILHDDDGNGHMDRRTVFLDSLVLPRALALVYGGLLYAEPPNLWFVEIDGDRPGKRTLVDAHYAEGGNVEHQPNGLLLNLDNWIYSAKSDARYRRIRGRWVKEKTAFRGQWGITHDDFGRLYYNDNSNQLQGDWVLPNALFRNPYFQPDAGLRVQICTDQRVYPLQATAVNRGYQEGMLDSTGRLRNVTSACAPWIYRGDQFPKSCYGNAFVCAPEANLLKRNVFLPDSVHTRAEQAYAGREFLAATDPAFRPVGLTDGPDGALYVLDMHHGIIQHKTYMTAYLREKIQTQGLDTVRNMGRILRIHHTGAVHPIPPRLADASAHELLQLLRHPNGWVRDKAQQMLVERGDTSVAPTLRNALRSDAAPLFAIHALWTLEGLSALDTATLLRMCRHTEPWVAATALQLLVETQIPLQESEWIALLHHFTERKHPVTDLALCLFAGSSYSAALLYLKRVATARHTDPLYRNALLSGLAGREMEFVAHLRAPAGDTLNHMLKTASADRKADRKAAWTSVRKPARDGLTSGLNLYNQHCAGCHGPTGQGAEHLAPPLDGSEFIHGNPKKVIYIALFGLEGPISVRGRTYTFNAGMPGLGANPDLSDEELAAILSFVRNAFSKEPGGISAEQIKEARADQKERTQPFSADDLKKIEKH